MCHLILPKDKITEPFQTLGLFNIRWQRKIFSSQSKRNRDFEALYIVIKNWWRGFRLPAGFSFCYHRYITDNLSLIYIILSVGATWLEHQACFQIYLVPTSITQFILSCTSQSLLHRSVYIKEKILIYLQTHIFHISRYICFRVRQNTYRRRAGLWYIYIACKIPRIISTSRPDNDIFLSKIAWVLYSILLIPITNE